jgi:hypothetical protein
MSGAYETVRATAAFIVLVGLTKHSGIGKGRFSQFTPVRSSTSWIVVKEFGRSNSAIDSPIAPGGDSEGKRDEQPAPSMPL